MAPAPPSPSPVVAPAPPAVAPAPLDPHAAWVALLEGLPALGRVSVNEGAGFLAYEEGCLHLVARSEFHRARVWETLEKVDLALHFPGFRRLDLRVDGHSGQTGREARTEGEARRASEADIAARAAPVIQRLLECFGGHIESVTAITPIIRDMDDPHEEEFDG